MKPHAEVNGDYKLSAQLHREGLRLAQSLEMWSEESRQLSGLGRIALFTERYEEAGEFHRRALRLAIEQGHRPAEQTAEPGLALGAPDARRISTPPRRICEVRQPATTAYQGTQNLGVQGRPRCTQSAGCRPGARRVQRLRVPLG